MDEHVLAVLEFDRVRLFLESFAQSAGGRSLCRRTRPQTQAEEVRILQQQTTEMLAELERSGPLALGGVHDIERAVQQTRMQNFHLDQEQLLSIAETLETAASVKAFFAGLQDTSPALFDQTGPLITLPGLVGRIRASISSRGTILDSASERLGELRRQMRSLRARIMHCLGKYLHDVDLNFAVQDDFITLRNNRFVIPVRNDRKTLIPGVVHDQSQSKATFFVEPLDVLELNNSLQITQRDEQHEEIRILTELTRAVQEHEQIILSNLGILEGLDAIHARARLSKALSAQPPFIGDGTAIDLKNCRHPILSARFVPPPDDGNKDADTSVQSGSWQFDRSGVTEIDIVKPDGIRTLIITGANAGGKTVALKTLGLFVLMHQSGMHLPTGPHGRIAVYERLFADIGDEQNIEASLSTFSAHMERIKTVVRAATPCSLVLLDELGSGTDPAEGGALAAAILDHLRALGCTTLVTSHLSLLKTYAFSHADAENVSVEFDPRTHRPLYRLVYGVPGFSNALAIARAIGIPEEILQTAGRYAGQADRQAADLLQALEHAQRTFREQCARLQEQHGQHVLLNDACRRLLATMHNRRDSALKKFEETARSLLRDSENRLRAIIRQHRRDIRGGAGARTGADALRHVLGIKQELSGHFPATHARHPGLDRVQPGQIVTVVSLKKNGMVSAVDSAARRAEISIGSMRVNAGFEDLAPSLPQATPPGVPAARPNAPYLEKQINVIGMRADEALPLIDKCIDSALVHGADAVEIIHGRGTGRLMRAIHEHLQGHPDIARLTSGSGQPGGSGVTRIELK